MKRINRHLGSETFGTSIMKTDEVLLFVKVAKDNGANLETAYNNMKMIDDILQIKRLHLAVHGHIKKTSRGHLRKGSSLYDAIDSVINANC